MTASAPLRALHVVRIWLDQSGVGWTREYRLIVHVDDEPDRRTRRVIQSFRRAPTLDASVEEVLMEALSGLEVPARARVSFSLGQRQGGPETIVWPLAAVIERLVRVRDALDAEIARIRALED